MTIHKKFGNQLNAEHSLGKGEVVSSILPGSTRNPYKITGFSPDGSGGDVAIAQNVTRIAQPESWKKRGLCSADVPLTGPELAGLAAIAAATLLMISTALWLAPPCQPSDHSTINGRELCPARAAR